MYTYYFKFSIPPDRLFTHMIKMTITSLTVALGRTTTFKRFFTNSSDALMESVNMAGLSEEYRQVKTQAQAQAQTQTNTINRLFSFSFLVG